MRSRVLRLAAPVPSRALLRTCALACALLLPASAGAQPARPNILLLVAEDMGPRVGAFGDPVAVTPNLDALAARGTRYPHTFTTAGVCAPSRAALITGLHQNALGAGHMRSHDWSAARYRAVPPAEVKALPELLRRAGYFTYVTSKLDYQFSGVLPGQGPSSIWDAESLLPEGVGWNDRPEGVPFFGMYAFNETHESALFPRDVWPRSPTHLLFMVLQAFAHRGSPEPVTPEQVEVPPYYPDTPIVRRDIARHYNNIVTMDAAVGRILSRLQADGLADDTVVLWTTDHGDGLPRAKRELFDSGTRVPLVIAWPDRWRPDGLAPGASDPRLVSFVDLAPQILAMAGVEPPAMLHGRPFAGEATAEPRRYVFMARDRMDEAPDRQRAVRDRRYRYIRNHRPGTPGFMDLAFRDTLDIMRELRTRHERGELDAVQSRWFEPRPPEELYDLRRDPHEIRDLAGDPAHAAVLERLRGALDAWQARVPDLGALPEAALAERCWPGGEEPVTEAPTFDTIDTASGERRLRVRSATPGASLEIRVDGGRWQLYREPLGPRAGSRVEARAVRYGWAGSAISTHRVE